MLIGIFLNDRLRQNGLWEKLTVLWIDKCLRELKLRAQPHPAQPDKAMA